MPRGKYTNHKGRARRFTSPEELEEQSKQDQFKQRQRKKEESGESEASEEDGSGSSDSESEGEDGKGKGVEKLIEVENPNRIQKKSKKLSTLNTEQSLQDSASKPELSRREREELEKQRAYAHYTKMHAEGKTEEARADLARLAIIKKQREEAAQKRELEKQAKEAAKQAKTAATNKALGKKA